MTSSASVASVAILGANVVGGVLGLLFALVAKNRQDAPAADAYKRLVLVVACWSFSYAGVLAASDLVLAQAFDALAAGFSAFAAFLWLVFAVEYTGHAEWLTRRRLGLLLAEPAVYAALYATNALHGWAYADPELAGMGSISVLTKADTALVGAQIGVIYLVNLVAFALLIRFMLRTRNIYRKQTVAIVVGPMVLFVGNVLFVAGLSLHRAYDPTPVAFVLTSVFVGVALFRYDFLNVAPLAADMLIDEMNDAVVVLDEGDAIIDANPAATALFDADDVEGTHVDAVLPGLVATLGEGDDGELYARSLDGRDRVYDPDVTPVTDQHGIERGRLVVLRDVTVQQRRQEELRRKNDRLEQFVSVVSHDLRNPLNVARGYVDLAQTRDEETALEQADDALARTEEMVDELLELARQGRTVDDPEAIRVGEAARAAWSHVETAEATLVVEADRVVEADPTRLQEAFENLFRNAVEHGGGAVTVRVEGTDRGFALEDDGPGFSADDLATVFQSGYTTAENGTGFGLDIVESIVEAHGWTIDATEGSDGGARFEVRIAPPADGEGPRPDSTAADRHERGRSS